MSATSLREGDPVTVSIRGVQFDATVRSFPPAKANERRVIGVDPVDPNRFSYRFAPWRSVKPRKVPVAG